MTYGRFCSARKTILPAGSAPRTQCMHSIVCSVCGMRSWYHFMLQGCSPQRKGVLEFHVNGTDTSHTCWPLSQLEAKSLSVFMFSSQLFTQKEAPICTTAVRVDTSSLSHSTIIDRASGNVVVKMLDATAVSKLFTISHVPLRDFPEVAACGWTITRVVSAYYAGGLSVR